MLRVNVIGASASWFNGLPEDLKGPHHEIS